MTSVRRSQAERSAATREALLDAAIECLIEEGYASTTTNAVAVRAGRVARRAPASLPDAHRAGRGRGRAARAALAGGAARGDRGAPGRPGPHAGGPGPAVGALREPALPGRDGPVDRRALGRRAARAADRGRADARPRDARARPHPVPRAGGRARLRGAAGARGRDRPRPGDPRHPAPRGRAQPAAVGGLPIAARRACSTRSCQVRRPPRDLVDMLSLTLADPTASGALTVFPLLADTPPALGYVSFAEAVAARRSPSPSSPAARASTTYRWSTRSTCPSCCTRARRCSAPSRTGRSTSRRSSPARSELRVPVSCVEHGPLGRPPPREAFTPAPQAAYPALRRVKNEQARASVAAGGEARARQGEVWAAVVGQGRASRRGLGDRRAA